MRRRGMSALKRLDVMLRCKALPLGFASYALRVARCFN